MKKKIFLAFGLGAVLGAGIMYLRKEKQLEELREIFDDEEELGDYEENDDFFDEELDEDFDENYPDNKASENSKEQNADETEKAEIAKD